MDLSWVGLKTLRLQIPRHEMTLKEVISENGAFRSGHSKYLNPKENPNPFEIMSNTGTPLP